MISVSNVGVRTCSGCPFADWSDPRGDCGAPRPLVPARWGRTPGGDDPPPPDCPLRASAVTVRLVAR